ncbi:thioredoxin [Ilumatobacter fluminis]|uniref:Thioredoxin n=1 Tax=Ilumatobacter fluminis TaxID=467091 RepID=A0A4R7HUC0_9ACTN|nr:thioredoxin [Ilumatobacter fluminis]TDT14512.1 thioredoxin [Ilumatobacter fluminis]
MGTPVVACPSCGTKNRVPFAAKGHPRCPKCQTDLPWTVDAGDADFATAVDTSALVIVDLWAPWCGPCRMVAPILDRISSEFAGRVKIVKVNVDESPMTAQRYEARSIPMMLFMRGGDVVNTVVGAQPEHVMRTLVEGELRSGRGVS